MFFLGFILYGTLCASWTWVTISFPMWKVFHCNALKYFSYHFSFSSSSGVPIIQMLVPLMLSQKSLFPFILFFFFILLCFSFSTILFSSTLLHSSSSFILPLVPSKQLLISVIVLFTVDCLFFNSSMPLLNIACIFSIRASSLSVPPFLDFRSSLLSLLWILFEADCLFLHLFGFVSFYHIFSAGCHSVFSYCLIYCVWYLLSAGQKFIIALHCLVCSPWVGWTSALWRFPSWGDLWVW